jgi:hypothetical protein
MKSEDWIVISLIAVGIFLLTRSKTSTTSETTSATISQMSEGLSLMDIFANAVFV